MNQRLAGPEFLTLAQAAEIVGTSERTVRRLIESGSLPAFRIGPRAVRVRIEDVRAQAKPIPAGGAK
ncbi:helix-turn-helix domain-containing protein [Pseudarthrobacter sp. WHRI 8279]|uniref:helix-turn-helix transcriptional regulator n=1 Tax=Pseudarthrobacter sp. WHRI 8279 TaxID=3162566 RepID=UPI0032ED8A27